MLVFLYYMQQVLFMTFSVFVFYTSLISIKALAKAFIEWGDSMGME